MRIWRILALVVAAGAIALLLFLVRGTLAADTEAHQQRLSLLRQVDALDVGLNRAVSQVGVSSMASIADVRAVTTSQLGEALDRLELPDTGFRGLSPAVDAALAQFLDTIESKFELAFDFEARNILVNLRLVAGMVAVPAAAAELSAALPVDDARREALDAVLTQLTSEVTTYGVVQTPTNRDNITQLLEGLLPFVEDADETLQRSARALRQRTQEVLADKDELVRRMTDFLGRPTAEHLQGLEEAYTAWHLEQVAVADQYREWLVAYAALLLLSLAWLGIRLNRSYRALDEANEHLEEQVVERTRDLSSALENLRASQAQLIQSEKMASLGQMVAGVAHEINTPLGYVRSNHQIVRGALGELGQLCSIQSRALGLMTDEQASEETVAEALSEADRLSRDLQPDTLREELDTLMSDAEHGLVQITELVGSLKDFSRVDRSRNDLFNLHDGIESALKIGQNQLKGRIEVVRHFGELPMIECSPSQLNQVFLNLITNAAQAIDGEGRIYIHTAANGDHVQVRVLDTGCGMPEEVRARIFEPFYTTKPVGKGTGLGLSIVFRIIEDHGGRIDVRSVPGKGSEFIIDLPVRQPRNDAASDLPAAA